MKGRPIVIVGLTRHVQVNVYLIDLLAVLGAIVEVIAIAWPGVRIAALVIVFAICAFIAAALQAMRVQQPHRGTGCRPPAARAD